MEHGPDAAQERRDKAIVIIYGYDHPVAGATGVFQVLRRWTWIDLAIAIDGTPHFSWNKDEIRISIVILIATGAYRNFQVAWLRWVAPIDAKRRPQSRSTPPGFVVDGKKAGCINFLSASISCAGLRISVVRAVRTICRVVLAYRSVTHTPASGIFYSQPGIKQATEFNDSEYDH